ncbi:MAG: TIGR03009 domain-containing protein [Gemmataceae bacterium]
MFRAGFATIGILALGLPLLAQQPGGVIPVPGSQQPSGLRPGGIPVSGGGQVQPAAPVDPKLLAHLQAWEERMKSISNVVCKAEKVANDNVMKRQITKDAADILCMKPNFAFMKVVRTPVVQPDDAKFFTTWICDGKSIHQYSGAQKEYQEFKLAANGNIQGNLLLEFISGSMTAAAAMQRFDIKLIGEDNNYVYLNIKPKLVGDREDFEDMTLVFYGPKLPPTLEHIRYLPAMVKMTKNGNKEEEVWTFKQPQVNVKGLTPDTFKKQDLPAGWKVGKSAAAPSTTSQTNPRVIRP